MTTLALDTSAAVPLLLSSHTAHQLVRRQLGDRTPVLTTHSLAETYSVLTRLPNDARVSARDAVQLIESRFAPAIAPTAEAAQQLPRILATLAVSGGAVYDALVGLAAAASDVALGTRDGRALGTYAAVGARCEIFA